MLDARLVSEAVRADERPRLARPRDREGPGFTSRQTVHVACCTAHYPSDRRPLSGYVDWPSANQRGQPTESFESGGDHVPSAVASAPAVCPIVLRPWVKLTGTPSGLDRLTSPAVDEAIGVSSHASTAARINAEVGTARRFASV
jgi:hypothetical protein